jgi:hypothetical protein
MRTRTALTAAAALATLTACAGGPRSLPVTITGPLETSDSNLSVTGEAADAGIICPEVTWDGRVYEDLDGNELTLEDLEHMPDDAKDVRWTDTFVCADGSGSFVVLHRQLLSRAEMDFEGYNEAASWEIESGTGSYTGLVGEGTFILDFVEGVVVNTGTVAAG